MELSQSGFIYFYNPCPVDQLLPPEHCAVDFDQQKELIADMSKKCTLLQSASDITQDISSHSRR